MAGDDLEAASHAKKIYPICKDGNLLLCTLLLGNVAVNSLLSISLQKFLMDLMGFSYRLDLLLYLVKLFHSHMYVN
jgi:metal transporter CNNM